MEGLRDLLRKQSAQLDEQSAQLAELGAVVAQQGLQIQELRAALVEIEVPWQSGPGEPALESLPDDVTIAPAGHPVEP